MGFSRQEYWSGVPLPSPSYHYLLTNESRGYKLYIVLFLNIVLGHFLEKEMAPHSSTLAWKIVWMEEPGRLQSMGSHRVGHD